jgi:hypothetical protein
MRPTDVASTPARRSLWLLLSPWRRILPLVSLGALASFAGCSLFNPYVRSDLLRCEGTSPDSCTDVATPYVGDAAQAIAAANDQRNLYMREMGSQYAFNSLTGVGILSLTADAIYRGVGTSSAATTRVLTAEAAGVGFLYGTDLWLHSKSTEAAYAVGFQSITCTLLRTRALLLTTEDHDHFQSAVTEFARKISRVDRKLSELQIEWDFGEEAGNTLANNEAQNLLRETRNAIKTLARSRKLLFNAKEYDGQVLASGQTIRKQVDLIVGTVSSQLAQSEPNITALKSLVGTFTDPSKGLAALQAVAVSPSGASSPTSEPSDGANNSNSTGKKQDGSSVNQSANTEEQGKTPAPSAAAAAAAAAAVTPAAGAAAAAVTPAPAAAAAAGTKGSIGYFYRQKLRSELSQEISQLYSAARPINAVLDTAQQFYTSTKHISACEIGGGPPPLEITPPTVPDAVPPGKTLKFSISGGVGIPEVTLTGATGSPSGGAKTPDLVLGVGSNALTATVTILPDASGTLTLTASDKGQPAQKTEVTIDVEQSEAKPHTFKATPGDKKIELSFSTPSAAGGTLSGYVVTLSSGTPATTTTLSFASAEKGTKATDGGNVTGEISGVTRGGTTVDLGGLTNGEAYTVGLTAKFTGAADVVYQEVTDVKPVAPPAPAPTPPSFTATTGDKQITLGFTTPVAKGGTLTGYVVTVSSGKPVTATSLAFSSPNKGTKATGGSLVTGEISADADGKTSLDVTGLVNGDTYSVGLTAKFNGASDVKYKTLTNVKPAASAATASPTVQPGGKAPKEP